MGFAAICAVVIALHIKEAIFCQFAKIGVESAKKTRACHARVFGNCKQQARKLGFSRLSALVLCWRV
jgi:N-acetylglutamate synthase-like GNAT family acetyltransferase